MLCQLRIAILTTCVWGILVVPGVYAQPESEYSKLMQNADRLLMESKVEEARSRYAQALLQGADDVEKTNAALFLAITFEKEGTLQEAELRAWAAQRFSGKEEREQIERGIEAYRQKFLGKALPETAATIHTDELSTTPPVPPANAVSQMTVNTSDVRMLESRQDNLENSMQTMVYSELIQRGEALNLQGKRLEARQIFAKALALEPKKDTLSQAAMGIVQSFLGDKGLDENACKSWSEANITVAEDRLRVALAIGELYYRNQDYDRAIAQLASVVKEKGSVAEMGSLVVALSFIGQGKRDAAMVELNRVASESSSEEISAKAMFLIGWAQLQAQQYQAAKEAFDKLVSEHPDSQFAKKAIELNDRLKAYAK